MKVYTIKFHIEKLYCSSGIVCMIILRRISWNKHVSFMREQRTAHEPWKGKYILE
jgi:hypothetical protein